MSATLRSALFLVLASLFASVSVVNTPVQAQGGCQECAFDECWNVWANNGYENCHVQITCHHIGGLMGVQRICRDDCIVSQRCDAGGGTVY